MNRAPTHPDFIAAALDMIGLAACACDSGGTVVAANAALARLLGVDAAGHALDEFFAAPQRAGAAAQLRAAAGAQAEQRWDASVLNAAGAAVAVQVWVKPLPEGAGLRGVTVVFNDVSVHQRDQTALRKTLLEQRAILENAAVGILFSRAGVIRECNIRAAEMFGYASKELAGRDGVTLYPSAEAYAALGRAAGPPLSTGRSFRTELQLRRQDGALFWARLYGRAVDPLNTADGTVWIVEDISEHRRDEDQLRRALLEMQAIMDSAPLAIGFQRNKRILRYNRRFAEFFGLSGDDGVGRPARSLYPSPAAYQAVLRKAGPLLARGQPYQAEMEMRRRDGSTFWAHAFGYVIKPGGPHQDTIWIFDDRSAQKAAEEATKQLLLEQKAILDNASVGILFSKERLMLSCNPRFADMFGYRRDELTGRPAADVFPSPEVYEAFGREAAPLLGSGQPFEKGEYLFKRKDGTLFWCRVRAKAVDQEHSEQGTIWILEDISASRQTRMEVEAIMTNASMSILFTKNRLITRYNRGFGDMFGYPGDSGLGLPGRALYPSQQSYDCLGAAAFPALSVGKPFQTEVEMQRSDGSMLWAQLIGYVVNPSEPAQGTIWIIEDRSEQKRAEESLRNALLENQAILDSAVLGIAVVEGGFNLRSNSKMEELFGYPPGGIVGLSVQALYPDRAAWDAARAETARDFSAGRVHMSEYRLRRRDGSMFWARLSGRPFDLAQANGRSVWLVDDVTARREAAEAVLRARDELELRVLERTAELAGANALLQGEIVERRQAEARVHHMAYHDSLTGLPNRALLSDRLDRAMLAAQRQERRLAVMFIDLDRFKTINDSLGHMTGDSLLKEVASRLCRAVRVSDTVARLGGDEFVVLVPGIRGAEESGHVAEKIIEALAAPFPLDGHTLHITPSIGICVYPDDGADVDTLMRHADAAMYYAKASGRNNYQFFTQRMNQAAAQHFELESSLRGALALHQFELFYQPIVDTGTRRLHTMEVLLRWRRPEHGLVLPDSFIPIIEENGLIVPIGEWVIRRACEQSMAWLRQGWQPVPLAVNLSPRQFMHRDLVGSIRRILDETGIDPALLEFEITETALMQHGEHTLAILGQINAMGIRLSIDDFGTGYSSLAYLKRFPVKKVKIDRAFVKDLEHSAEDRAIVAAIIALADSLQLSTVAEGVETEAQFALLQRNGCRYAQGYLFSQPVPQALAERRLDRLARPGGGG
ncbi:bifunctional diguanylate cyclase/phosphodiesterase [Janthinobacterium fluminis]|uniref:Bifunctional diguanylate cyclase/phosphodiesterase n=1 Tax=Janthinobacterium fluminis TaxID=2987524 RepID=A0ABT5JY67_9BURK|nr:bifunctional diguanylate cyclase/phosphodiesterase [Janthinobacterium fluminis]MDC8757652.1 bifunctional diguanylate cyclase/phosphodiesterase [Janthinobacterium fluminis]